MERYLIWSFKAWKKWKELLREPNYDSQTWWKMKTEFADRSGQFWSILLPGILPGVLPGILPGRLPGILSQLHNK